MQVYVGVKLELTFKVSDLFFISMKVSPLQTTCSHVPLDLDFFKLNAIILHLDLDTLLA